MIHVVEVVASLRYAGGAPEVIERNSSDAALGKSQRQLLVEAVEATHVREDHHADVSPFVRFRRESGEAVAVPCLQHKILV